MDLVGQKMWIADGNPCTAPYRELDYAGFLAKRSPVAQAADQAGQAAA